MPEAQPASQPVSLRLQGWLAGPQAWLDGPEGGTDGRTDERTNGRTENLPILQDFVPYRDRCQLAGPQAWLAGPQAWLAGPQSWLDGPEGEWTDRQKYIQTENLQPASQA